MAVVSAASVPLVSSFAQTTRPAPAGPREPAAPPVRSADRVPGDLMGRAAESNAQVYVDDSFASIDKIRKANQYSNQGQSQLAISEFQSIIDQYGQKLVYLNDSSYVSITDYVRERLLQLPAVRQGMYDQLYGGDAQKAVDAAIQGRDVATLIRVCDRFFPSAAAFSGLEQAGQWYFERGEFSPASRTWQLLLQHPHAEKKQAELLFRAALAETLAQNPVAATALRERLEKAFPDATGTFFGDEVKLVAKLEELAKGPPWDAVDLSREDWPAFDGGPSRSRLLDVNATIGARLWSISLDPGTGDATANDIQQRQARLLIQRRGQTGDVDPLGMGSFVVMANGTLFLHTGDRVVALSANAGAPLWTYPPLPTSRLTSQERTLTIPSPARMTAHDSVAVFGDSVFAVIPGAAGSGGEGFVDPRIVQMGGGISSSTGTSRVVCMKREDGTERWTCTANDVKLENQPGPAAAQNPNVRAINPRGAFSFVGSPLVTRQGVFIMARRVTDASFAQQYLVRLDRETGAVTWACYLCSTSSGAMYINPYYTMGSIAVPSLVDDVVYISTGQGADCAVDANIGRILWLRIVDTGSGARSPGDFYTNATTYVPAWKYNPPLVVRNSLIVADNNALRVYDRWTGKQLNKLGLADLGLVRLDVMAGIANDHLVLSGDRKTVYVPVSQLEKPDAKSIKNDWQVEVPNEVGRPQGRPFLTTGKYYVPFEKKLVQIDLSTGKSDTWDWPNTEKDVPGRPGNLLVTAEQVVVVNDAEIAGYSKWETARDNRLAKIKESPKDPRRYLDLAEIAFRTEHFDIARENMKSSVDLANGGADGAGVSNAEILYRLYRTNLNFAEQLLAKADTALRDQSRFYFEQCRASAREPEQQAEWRLRLAELALKQKRPDEAATLYSEVLVDPALRVANYRESDVLASSGATAEQRIRKLIADSGPDVYRRFEDQATGLLEKAIAGRDLAGLQLVMEGYPNSKASVKAATELATASAQKQDWQTARRVLWWLVPRVKGDDQARAIADLVRVCIGLKKYASASAWANRGVSQFKDLAFTTTDGQKTTFAEIKKQVAAAGVPDAEGRLPHWFGTPTTAPPMETMPLDDSNLLSGTLLIPVETSPAYRQPNLLFLKKAGALRVFDTAKGSDIFAPVPLGNDQPCALLGVTNQKAILLQKDRVLVVDLKTQQLWAQKIQRTAGSLGAAPITDEDRQQLPANIRIVGGGVVRINGQIVAVGPDGFPIDDSANRTIYQGGGDAEVARRTAILSLDNPNFSSARLLNNKVLIVSGSTLSAYNVDNVEPAWRDRDNKPVTVRLPDGRPVAIVGNEDVIVAQVDSADNSSSTFLTIDADTGQSRRTIRLKSDRATWRALGDDGRLYVVSNNAVAAYDLIGGTGEQETPQWRRTDIQTRFASASALTLDGLLMVDNSLNVWCLSLESGESRWPNPPRLPLISSVGTITVLRSMIDGDNVIFQSSQNSAAYHSVATGSNQTAWEAYYPANTPTLQAMQLTDLHVVELAIGALNTTERAVRVVFRDRRGGRIAYSQEIIAARGGAADRAGPMLRGWQVLDNGIALLVGDETHFWRNKTDAAPADPNKVAPKTP